MGKIAAFYTMPHPPIIIPEVGRGEEEKIKQTSNACFEVAEEIKNIKPDTIIIITPHGPLFRDAISISFEENIYGDLGNFGVQEISISSNINISLTKEIIKLAEKENITTVNISKDSADIYGIEYELDHGSIVPLYFVNKKYTNYNLIHITYGMLSKLELYKFGMCIKKAVEESDTTAVFIASGDLSHKLKDKGPYNYSPYGEKFDKEIINLLQNGDVIGIFNMDKNMIEQAGECGLRSYYIMLGAMNGYEINGKVLAYEGTFGVGYGVIKFNLTSSNKNFYELLIENRKNRISQTDNEKDLYVRLARESLTYYLKYGDILDIPEYIPEDMLNNKRGVFVSLKKEGMLRGCIGTFLPTTENIAREVIRNAVEAGVHDPRFSEVREEELPDIDFSVDVLTKPKKATKDELNPKKYGVIVRKGYKSGLLLPDLEGVDTVDYQLEIALQKAGIYADDDYSIERFEVIRHK